MFVKAYLRVSVIFVRTKRERGDGGGQRDREKERPQKMVER